MATRFVSVDHDTPLLLPPNLREWVRDDHLVHFVLDAVAALNLSQVKVNLRGTGSEQYPPTMMLGLLIYSYATGNFSSRRIEQSTYDSVPVRLLTADTHPDHDTLCTFRRENQALLSESFVKILQLAQQLKVLQVGQITVAVDGTKILANASKHSAVSYERAGQMIEQLELEVKQLLAKAEQADSAPLQEGLTIPQEIVRRQERKAALEKARAEIEARAHARYAAARAERVAKSERGQKVGGKPPQAPTAQPEGTEQYNFTDPQSRIMKAAGGNHFEQSYNAQAAVEVQSRLVVGQRVCPSPNDKQELGPTLAAIPAPVGWPEAVLTDSGFYSENAVRAVEHNALGQPNGTTVYAAIERQSHHRSVADLEKKTEPEPPPANAGLTEIMKHRLATVAGKQKYKLRQQTVEPVFGIIKSVLGFRRFLLRGVEKVNLEWALVCAAYNLKRLHRLGGFKLAVAG
jgi:transposase